MKIFGFVIFCIISLSLLVWILGIGFQTQSLADVFTLSGAFSNWSTYDIIFTFVLPLIMVLQFIVIAFGIIMKF